MKRFVSWTTVFLCITLLTACGGGGGGKASASGDPTVGAASTVTAVKAVAPTSECPNGGISVDAGIDTNGNGVLDQSEVKSTQYVCNGADGTDGTDGTPVLVSMVDEPAGTHCPNGGKRINVGKDLNGNGALDANEITSSDYVCNGTNGTNGTDGTNGKNGTNGTNGTNGANGANGHNSLVKIVQVSPGDSSCPNGGIEVTYGIDVNNNGILDTYESSTQYYVCKGDTGATGPVGPQGPAGPGITWQDVTGTSVTAQKNKGYLADSTSRVTVTLPDSSLLSGGEIVEVDGIGTGGWQIAQNAGQSIITTSLETDVLTPRLTDSGRYWYGVASSADGTKLVAVASSDHIYTSTDSGITWTPRDSNRGWMSVASSSDGTKLVAMESHGQIYTSTDSGLTWYPRDSARDWNSVASSADGTNLVAGVHNGQIYTSTDSGLTWHPRDSNRNWTNVASSADGTKLVAVVSGGQIYTSTDSGLTWHPRDSNRFWLSVASSSDGTNLVAGVSGGQIYTSTDSGLTWTPRDSARDWWALALSADGTKLAAGTYGYVYTAAPSTVYTTTTGTGGYILGGQYNTISLQYIGSNLFTVLNYTGDDIVVR